MGCVHSNVSAAEPDKNCAQNNDDKAAGDMNGANKVDSRLPLDARQVFKLKGSWKGIKRRIEEAGVEMFIRLFKQNAYMKTLFTQFRGLETEDDMRHNEMLEQHATFVMSTLDEAISNIDNFDFVQSMLHRVGGSHNRFDDFRASNFWLIKGPFLEAMKITLGDRYTEYMQTVYELTIVFIIQNLVVGYSLNQDATMVPKEENNHTHNNVDAS